MLKKAIPKLIKKLKEAQSIHELTSIKSIKTHPSYYRYRIGNYRIGFKLINQKTIDLILIAKREDIYKKFP